MSSDAKHLYFTVVLMMRYKDDETNRLFTVAKKFVKQKMYSQKVCGAWRMTRQNSFLCRKEKKR